MRDYKEKDLYPNTNVLSSSQILDYAKDPSEFHMRWNMGIEKPKGKAMIFGQIFSEAYADRNFDYRACCIENGITGRLIDLTDKVLPLFPKLPKRNCEYELIVKLNKKWKVRITLDGYIPENRIIIENKTGQGVWTQEVCDTHPQITMQIWGHWKKTGKLPSDHITNWVDTSTQATKPIWTFHTKRTIEQLKEFEETLLAIVEGIEVGNFTVKRDYWQ